MNDTELMPALSTAFSDEAASSSSEGLETIFDAQRAQRAADAEIASAAAAAAEAAKADAADSVDEGAPSEVQTKLLSFTSRMPPDILLLHGLCPKN